MNRLGLSDPSSLNGEQKALYEKFTEYTTARYGDRYVIHLIENDEP